MNQPAFDFGMGCRLSGVYVHVLQSGTVTGDDVEQLILAHHFVDAYHLDDIKWKLVVFTEIDIRHAFPAGNRRSLYICIFIEHQAAVFYGSHFGGHVGNLDIEYLTRHEVAVGLQDCLVHIKGKLSCC